MKKIITIAAAASLVALVGACADTLGQQPTPLAQADQGVTGEVADPAEESANIVVTGGRVQAQNAQRTRSFAESAPPPPPPAPMVLSPSAAISAGEMRRDPGHYYGQGRDRFAHVEANGFKAVSEEPVSTFSIDVDTASYAFMRASLNRGTLPTPDAVRAEEMINYFSYDYPTPMSRERPFSTHVDVFPSPWAEGRKLVRIGIKGFELPAASRPRANLVFLIDTSGSMNAPNKLPLVRRSLLMLLDQLNADDHVAIVTYAGNAGTALLPAPARDKARIAAALESLGAGGSTAGGEGIRQAYALAKRNFDPRSVNRVILATDGDFNVGITSTEELTGFVEREREAGVFLSVLGFGMGNYNDALMQALAQNGNGNAAYVDTVNEARKTLVEEATSTLFPIAKDVKIQVEFNPANVAEYRLVGYETRMLKREDFNNDRVDAGEIGSGQSVTALYEIVPVGSARALGELRYRPRSVAAREAASEYGFVKIRYKRPDAKQSQLLATPISARGEARTFAAAPRDARFAVAVASFADLLRGGRYTGTLRYDDVLALANGARGADPFGYRAEFVELVRGAKSASAMARLGE